MGIEERLKDSLRGYGWRPGPSVLGPLPPLGKALGHNQPATDPRQAMELLPKLDEEEAGSELGGARES